jgi:hypothetical protein
VEIDRKVVACSRYSRKLKELRFKYVCIFVECMHLRLAPLLCTAHKKNKVIVIHSDSATQIALKVEIMRCNFTFGATLFGMHTQNMKIEGNKLR